MINSKRLISLLLVTFFVCSFQNKSPKIEKPKGFEHLVDIQSINPTICIYIKYATSENFMHKQLYFNIDKIYLQPDVALRLSNCQKFLKKINPSYSLLVYDGVRPLSVQKEMWEALDSIPPSKRSRFVSNPANGSVHNYGAAVDLTICDKNGTPIDMGAGYDDIREIAYPSKEDYYLKLGLLKPNQIKNRKLLRKVMEYQHFRNIPSEWWHFNACSRKVAKLKYKIIL